MAPRRKKNANWPALQFTEEFLDNGHPRGFSSSTATAQHAIRPYGSACNVPVPKVSFLQATREWLCNQFEDNVGRVRRLAIPTERSGRPSKATKENALPQPVVSGFKRPRISAKKKGTLVADQEQNRARRSRSYGQLEFYLEPVSRCTTMDNSETRQSSRSLSDETLSVIDRSLSTVSCNSRTRLSKESSSTVIRNHHFLSTKACDRIADNDAIIVLAPDTPESEYGMTIKMRQIRESKRRLF